MLASAVVDADGFPAQPFTRPINPPMAGNSLPACHSLQSRYPRISSYGFLSDCHTGALVAPDGLDRVALPAALRLPERVRLDPRPQRRLLAARPAGARGAGQPPLRAGDQRARDHLDDRLRLAGRPRRAHLRRLAARERLRTPTSRPPPDDEAEHVLVRTIECVQGEVDIEMVCQPVFDYGADASGLGARGDDGTDAEVTSGDLKLILTGDLGLGIDGPDARARHRMRTGEKRFSALSWGPAPHPARPRRRTASGGSTAPIDFWRRWLEGGNFPDHPWRGYLQRSALALKGLTYAPTGAMIAALTTSLPETPGGERNWDYRYTWIRDATFTLWALHTLGFDYEATDFMGWIADIYREGTACEQPGMQIMYGIRGEQDLTEKTLDHLQRLRGREAGADRERRLQPAPERRLRRAPRLRLHPRQGPGPPPAASSGRRSAARSRRRSSVWEKPDQGIWEARGEPKHYVSSKLMCWVALDRGCRLADRIGDERAPGALDEARRRRSATDILDKRGLRPTASSASTTRRTPSTPRPC